MLEIGSVVDGKYKILNKVGQGGMSAVYLCMNEKANKQWAIKEVRKEGLKDDEIKSQSLAAETEVLKKLNHPNLPSIVDVIEDEDRFLIVMDYVQGNSLAHALEEYGALPQEQVIDWAKQICDVLGYLHSRPQPIIYRDMKPANLMLNPDGKITLIDFGTAREYKDRNVQDTTCLGTPGYAAPEQFGGKGQSTERTDIYGLGKTLFHLVTGVNPGELPVYEIKPIREFNPALSSGLEKIILKCIQENPADRYQSAAELMYALEHYDEIDDIHRKKQKRKLAAFISCMSLSLICAGMSVWGYTSAEKKKKENYEIILQNASNVSSKEEAVSLLYEAIVLEPTRQEAYLQLNETLIEDEEGFLLTKEEGSQLQKLRLGLESDTQSGYTKVLPMLKENNLQAYQEVCYKIGESFLFYYETNLDRDRYAIAADWFIEAKEQYPMAVIYCEISECLDAAAQYNGKIKQTEKMNAEYKKLWEKTKLLKEHANAFDSIDTKLQVWNVIVATIHSNLEELMDTIGAEELGKLLAEIKEEAANVDLVVLQESMELLQEEISIIVEKMNAIG